MNYIKLINQFWQLRRRKRITSKQTDLYFFLLHECNERGWENPFECANKLIIASIDMQEPTLINARNRLKQLGLIEFIGGRKNEASPVYTVVYLNNLSRNRGEPLVETEENLKLNDEPLVETKLNETEKRESGASAPTPKSFKKFSEEEFKEDIRTGNAELNLPGKMLHEFFRYWSEKSASGLMKFQLEKTWDTKRRLETWRDNQAKFDRNGNKHSGTNGKNGSATAGRSIEFDKA